MRIEQSKTKFVLVGNNLSIDFVNTKIVHNDGPVDLLGDVSDIIFWGIAVGLFDSYTARRILSDWIENETDIFEEAKSFRVTLYDLFTALANGKMVRNTWIKAINNKLRDSSGRAEITRNESGFKKRFLSDFKEPAQLFASIASSAADLLCYGGFELVKLCEGENCVLYFYDKTKNHSRRWCSMAHCGNRAKANAFYQRKKDRGSVFS